MALKINELRQKRIDAKKKHVALVEAHQAAAQAATPMRDFTEAERKEQAESESAIAVLDSHIEAEEKRLKHETPAPAPHAGGRPAPVGDGSARIEVDEPEFAKDPKGGFRTHREYLRSVMQNSGLRERSSVSDERLKRLTVVGADKEERGAGAGELAFLLPRAYTPRGVSAAVGSDEQGEYSFQHGGLLQQTTRLGGILAIGFEGDPTAGRTTAVPMATPSVELIARNDKDHTSSISGGFRVSRKPETAAAADSRAQLEKITLKAAGLFGIAYESEELLTDSPETFLAIIDAGYRDQFAAQILREKLRGGGGNEYVGVLASPALITVAKESGQTAATIIGRNVVKMSARVWGLDQAIWIANHNAKPELYGLNIPVGTAGALIFQPSREAGFPDMLLGRPVFYSEFASTLGAVGDLMLCNWSQFLEGTYQPLQSAESMHVRFVNHERTFKFWTRNAGAPWWRVPMTPNQASDTLSPFVTLAARA